MRSLAPSIVGSVAEHGELDAGGAIGGEFRAAEFPVHAIDDADWKLDDIAARDLKRHLRLDGEGLHGFDVADAGTERAVGVKASARTLNEVTESLRLNETVAAPVEASVLTPAFQ